MSNDNQTTQCPNGCTHTDLEHTAFDLGRRAGGRGESEFSGTYVSDHLREIWRVGYSVGELEREAGQEVTP